MSNLIDRKEKYMVIKFVGGGYKIVSTHTTKVDAIVKKKAISMAEYEGYFEDCPHAVYKLVSVDGGDMLL